MKSLESYLEDRKLLKHAVQVAMEDLGQTEDCVLELLRSYRMKPCTSTKFLGRVKYRTRTFYISAHQFRDADERTETILHELAHVFARHFHESRDASHGYGWRAVCDMLGCEGHVRSDDSEWLDAALKFKYTRSPNHSWRRKGR